MRTSPPIQPTTDRHGRRPVGPRQVRRLAVAAAWLGCALAVAAAEPALPAPQVSHGVQYVSGGIGDNESAAFKRASGQHALAIEVYVRDGGRQAYSAGAEVTLRQGDGEPLLQARAEGPFMLVDAPPGRYTVEVTCQGVTQRRDVTLRAKSHTRSVFVFEAGV